MAREQRGENVRLQILGLSGDRPVLWETTGPAVTDGRALLAVLNASLPGMRFHCTDSRGEVPLHAVDAQTLHRLSQGPEPVRLTARPGPERDSDHPVRDRAKGTDLVVCVHDGPDSGRLVPLSRTGMSIGRAGARMSLTDPFLSAAHLRVDVGRDTVRVQGRSWTREWVAERRLTAGSSELGLFRGRPDPLPRLSPPPPMQIDPGPAPARPSLVLQTVMALSPLVIGMVMAVVTGLWYFLLFSLVSVLVTGVVWLQHRRVRRRHGQVIVQRTAQLVDALEKACPGPGMWALAARSAQQDRFGLAPETESCPTDRNDGPPGARPAIRWGTATAIIPVVHGSTEMIEDRRATSSSRTTLPVVSVLAPGQRLDVVGHPHSLDASARWALLQLIREALLSGRGVAEHTDQGVRELVSPRRPEFGGTLLVRGTQSPSVPPGWSAVWFRSSRDVSGSAQALSRPHDDGAALRVDLHGRSAHLDGLDYAGLRWSGISSRTFDLLLDELLDAEAGLVHRREADATAGLLDLPRTAPCRSAVDRLEVAVDATAQPTLIDLVADGPHVLVAGTTGSGKSELVLTLLSGIASTYAPTEASFVLMDFKGGSSFAVLRGLPHTMSVETNLGDSFSWRSLDALAAELRRREEVFLAVGVADYRAYRRAHPRQHLPRLVVAVDELRVLVDEHPRAADLLMRLASTGRSLGFHLLLATQRAQGAVGPDVRSNLGSVICLRTASEQESWDLVSAPDAARIPADRPGGAVLRRGGGPLEHFRAARYSCLSGTPGLREWSPGRSADGSSVAPWPDVVRHISALCREAGLPAPRSAILPDLPDRWSPATGGQPDSAALSIHRPGGLPLALVDDTAACRQSPCLWRPFVEGPVGWIGSDAGALDEVARAVVAHARDAASEQMWGAARLMVLDGGGWLPADALHPRSPTDASEGLLVPSDLCTPEALASLLEDVQHQVTRGDPVLMVITHWGRVSGLRVGSGFETLEERMAALLRDTPAEQFSLAVFGGRELAGGRLLGHIRQRFYVPAGTTPEHRMVWPRLTPVREVPGRAVLVSPDHPAPGLAVQLAVLPDATEDEA